MPARKLIKAGVATLVAGAAITGSLLGAGAANATSDPYHSDGMWMVPSEITPGTYRVTPTSSIEGYTATCADYTCRIDFDGSDATGMIDNELYPGPGILVIPANAVMVKLQRVSLTRLS